MRYGLRVMPPTGVPQTAANMMAYTRETGFGDEVKRRIILGTYALSAGYYDAWYGSAQKVRTLIIQDFHNAFEKPTCWSPRPARPPRSSSARR